MNNSYIVHFKTRRFSPCLIIKQKIINQLNNHHNQPLYIAVSRSNQNIIRVDLTISTQPYYKIKNIIRKALQAEQTKNIKITIAWWDTLC